MVLGRMSTAGRRSVRNHVPNAPDQGFCTKLWACISHSDTDVHRILAAQVGQEAGKTAMVQGLV